MVGFLTILALGGASALVGGSLLRTYLTQDAWKTFISEKLPYVILGSVGLVSVTVLAWGVLRQRGSVIGGVESNIGGGSAPPGARMQRTAPVYAPEPVAAEVVPAPATVAPIARAEPVPQVILNPKVEGQTFIQPQVKLKSPDQQIKNDTFRARMAEAKLREDIAATPGVDISPPRRKLLLKTRDDQ